MTDREFFSRNDILLENFASFKAREGLALINLPYYPQIDVGVDGCPNLLLYLIKGVFYEKRISLLNITFFL